MIDASAFPEARPLDPQVGLNPRRERTWGFLGGLIGALVGGGLALEAVLVEHSGWHAGGSYPPFFATQRLLTYDFCLLTLLLAGGSFSVASLVFARVGRYPRTDACGAGLLGLILSTLGGVILFFRLFAVIRGG